MTEKNDEKPKKNTVRFKGKAWVGYKANDDETYSGDKTTGVVEVPKHLATDFAKRHELPVIDEDD